MKFGSKRLKIEDICKTKNFFKPLETETKTINKLKYEKIFRNPALAHSHL